MTQNTSKIVQTSILMVLAIVLAFLGAKPIADSVLALFPFSYETRIGHFIHFFVEDTLKISLLLISMVYFITLARTHVDNNQIKAALQKIKKYRALKATC